jgi:hypothetical protein
MGFRLFAVWAWVIFTAMGAWPPAASHAYVPAAGHLLEAAAAKRETPSTAVVRQTRILPPQEGESRAQEYQETVYFRFPGILRAEMESDQGQRIYLERNGDYRIADSQGVSQPFPDPLDLALRLLANPQAAGMGRVLTAVGVDLSVSSLGLFNGRLGFVLGARYPDELAPQVWFDKETLLPFRWLIVRSDDSGLPQRIEIRYFTWQKVGALLYPHTMEGYRHEHRTADVRVDGIDPGADISDERFSFQRLLEEHPPAVLPAAGQIEMVSPVQ